MSRPLCGARPSPATSPESKSTAMPFVDWVLESTPRTTDCDMIPSAGYDDRRGAHCTAGQEERLARDLQAHRQDRFVEECRLPRQEIGSALIGSLYDLLEVADQPLQAAHCDRGQRRDPDRHPQEAKDEGHG